MFYDSASNDVIRLMRLPGVFLMKQTIFALKRARFCAKERKIVLATSIAETSLTIEGVTIVIDGGLARVPRYDPGAGLTQDGMTEVGGNGNSDALLCLVFHLRLPLTHLSCHAGNASGNGRAVAS